MSKLDEALIGYQTKDKIKMLIIDLIAEAIVASLDVEKQQELVKKVEAL